MTNTSSGLVVIGLNPAARAVLKRELPSLFAKPGIEQAHSLTLRELD